MRGDIDKMEGVQKKIVAAVTGLKSKDYRERLAEMGMTTLEKRRLQLDLQQTFKILSGNDNVDWRDWFEKMPEPEERQYRTRASEGGLRLRRGQLRLEVRRNFFSQRVVEKWNNLPASTRRSANMTQFKSELRKVHPQLVPV